MSKAFKLTLDIAALVIIGVIAALVAYSLRDPQFKVSNKSTEVVFVVASWAEQEKDIGSIHPSTTHLFSIDAEAAMKFSVRYPGGRKVESENIYFTHGTTVIATITRHGIEVRYDFEP